MGRRHEHMVGGTTPDQPLLLEACFYGQPTFDLCRVFLPIILGIFCFCELGVLIFATTAGTLLSNELIWRCAPRLDRKREAWSG